MAEKKEYKVKVTVGDATVEIEGAEQGVVSIVSALSKILEARPQKPSLETVGQTVGVKRSAHIVDIRSFFDEKKPSSDIEATAVVAFYYEHVAPIDERRDSINAETLKKAFQLARWKLPTRTILSLTNTRRAGYLETGPQTGSYRLNAVGYNLVEHTLGRERTETPKSKKKKAKDRKVVKKSKRKSSSVRARK
ncbi:MAG: hypothetical protein WBF13_02725 [Candidatus Zixiibacteriota bacterium]